MSADSYIYHEKKKPLIPFPSIWNSMYFCVMQILQLSAVTGYSCSILFLEAHFCSDKMEQGMKKKKNELRLLFPRCQYDTVRSSRKLDYPPTQCIMISFQFKSVLWTSCGSAVSCCHTIRVKEHRDEHNGWHLELRHFTLYVSLQHVLCKKCK